MRSVVRSTESWWSSFPAYGVLTGVGPGMRLWLPGPLDATMNLYAAVHAAVVGAEIVERPADATHACVTPALLDRRLADLAEATTVTVAGASLLRSLADRAESAGHAVRHYYGAAELSFVAAGRDADSLTAFPGVQVEIRGGEIWVRSRYLAVHTTGSFRREGDWATVGDLGRLEDGRLVVTGRPDAVVTAGATVVLAEVEQVLAPFATSPFAGFGVDRASVGQLLALVVTSATDVPLLREAARRALRADHRPRLWFVTDELPLTTAGKVDRRALSELVAGGGLDRA